MPTRLLLLALTVLMAGSAMRPEAQTAPPVPALPVAAGQPPAACPLSLAQAVQMAQAYSTSNHAAAARVEAAAARVREARAPESPALTLARNFGSSEVATDEGALLTQTLQVGAKRGAPIRRAQAAREAAAAEAGQASLEVTRAVREAYYEALQADAARTRVSLVLPRVGPSRTWRGRACCRKSATGTALLPW